MCYANARNLLFSLIFRFDTCYVRARQIEGFSRKTRRTLHISFTQVRYCFDFSFYVNLTTRLEEHVFITFGFEQ